MNTLPAFLLARIAEDEERARSASDVCSCGLPGCHTSRALAKCAADRQIVKKCREILAVDGWEYEDAPNLAAATLRLLAQPYADHPDYRDEWRP